MLFYNLIIFVLFLIQITSGSYGDQSPHFQNCLRDCLAFNCTKDKTYITNNVQPFFPKLLLWNCEDECKYECMWKTTKLFQKRSLRVPQFYGKWPFVRIAGIQEPASVLFSILNFCTHYVMLKKVKTKVRKDSPLYWLWYTFSLICMNAWIWSTIFHARDLPVTEFMDYACAFSIVVASCYCMIIRFLWPQTSVVSTMMVSVFFGAFFLNHSVYLSYGRFDYSYNMLMNISIGALTVLSWCIWAYWNKNRQPYTWKCISFFVLTALLTTLELFDFPPIFWMFDSHAIWHLSTAVICPLLYSFIIDDCAYLRKQQHRSDIFNVIEKHLE